MGNEDEKLAVDLTEAFAKGPHTTPEEHDHIMATVRLAREAQAEIERLREKCDQQAMILRRIYIEKYPDTWFVCGEGGPKDTNGLPERIHVCPAYGCDWSVTYIKVTDLEGSHKGMGQG